jgi:hypothetical protein
MGFAKLGKLAKHKQTSFIGNGTQNVCHFASFCLKICCLHGHFHTTFILDVANLDSPNIFVKERAGAIGRHACRKQLTVRFRQQP